MKSLETRFLETLGAADNKPLKNLQQECAMAGNISQFVALVQQHKQRVDEINAAAKAAGLATWQDGVYFLRGPGRPVLLTCDKIIYRETSDKIEFLVADRKSPCHWGQDGLPMATIGGFADANMDAHPIATASREVAEEIGQLTLEVEQSPLIMTGYWKWSHYWDGTQAVSTQVLAQEIPICTINFLARCTGGELNESNEATNPRWVAPADIAPGTLFAFDHALVLEAAIERLELMNQF